MFPATHTHPDQQRSQVSIKVSVPTQKNNHLTGLVYEANLCVQFPILTTYSYCNKLVSVRGIVQSRGHRIDASSLPQTPSPPPPMLVFRLQSTSTPDSIMIYYKSPIIHTLPLGLVPGCEVTFYSFNMNISKSGNVYCTNSPSSSLSVHSVEGLDTIDSQRVYGISISMTRLPTILVHELTQCLLSGCLPRRVVCVRGCLLSTQKVCLTYKCRGCQCVIVNGQCMVACLQRRPFLVADGR